MATSIVPISTQVVSNSTTGTISFTNIPQIYNDLYILMAAKSTYSGAAFDDCLTSINGDSGWSYSHVNMYGALNTNTLGLSSYQVPNTTLASTAYFQGSVSTGSSNVQFSSIEMYIPNYTSFNNKVTHSTSSTGTGIAPGTTGTYGLPVMVTSTYRTNAPIYSISFSTSTPNYFTSGSTITLYGVLNGAQTARQPKAIGGTAIVYGTDGYIYHFFGSTGTSTFTPTTSITADILTVAGGGGGSAGGGGAGGLVYTAAQTLTAGTSYSVTVGAGGAGRQNNNTGNGTNGGNSSVSGTGLTTITAIGGGGGGQWSISGSAGGSGGGGGNRGSSSGGAGTSGQGYAGGNSIGGNTSNAAGGGGGAGAVGGSDTNSGVGGNGGAGLFYFGAYWAGGGGGGGRNTGSLTAGAGGAGGGGMGDVAGGTYPAAQGFAGATNSGGGGGGSGYTESTTLYGNGGNGGSGAVVIRYQG
jgi:hypothetical protein